MLTIHFITFKHVFDGQIWMLRTLTNVHGGQVVVGVSEDEQKQIRATFTVTYHDMGGNSLCCHSVCGLCFWPHISYYL